MHSMRDQEWLAGQFEAHRTRLRAVAYRMLGSLSEADDAVQESWLRLSRSDAGGIENLSAWLTTVLARVCLNMLRSRQSRRQEPLGVHVPDPIVSHADDSLDPEHAALLADSVGLALLVILNAPPPEERLSFLQHVLCVVPSDKVVLGAALPPAAARHRARRARRRVRGSVTVPDRDLRRQREVVDAFLAAARGGDF